MARVTPAGYGELGRGRAGEGNVYAHRLSWELHHGDPGQLHVLHKCDTPQCVNPDHLFLGTHHDNMRDMFSKGRGFSFRGRWLRGEEHPTSKLTRSQVLAIRASQQSIRGIARSFAVSQRTVQFIRRGLTWRHVQ